VVKAQLHKGSEHPGHQVD
jgi:hypothetical protein